MTATSDAGNFCFSFAAAGISPVSISAVIFSASVFPIPSISVSRPSFAICSSETGDWRAALAPSL